MSGKKYENLMSDLNLFADIQLSHSYWTTRRVLESCAVLTHDLFTKPFEIGEGSLHAVLSHLLEGMGFFADVLGEQKYPASVPFQWTEPDGFTERASTADGQIELIDEVGPAQRNAALALLDRKGPDEFVWWPNIGAFVPVRVSIAQVIDHASYHRAQCNNMLRHVGSQPLDVDVHVWAEVHGLRRGP
jgi:uncharacterized damage-inducible protein DinB